MANDFDRIFKENVEPTLPILAKLLFGIQYTSVEEVKDKMQFTLEREPDFLKKVYIAASTQLELIQFEFQSQNEDKIDARMLVYIAKLRKLREITIKKLENMPLIIELTEQEIQTDPFFKKGLQKGLEKKDAELIEIIQTSLLEGLSIDLISTITKVDVKTIKKIQRAMKKKK